MFRLKIQKILNLTLSIILILGSAGAISAQSPLKRKQDTFWSQLINIYDGKTNITSHNEEIFDWFGYSQATGKSLYSIWGEENGLALYTSEANNTYGTVLLKTGLNWASWNPAGNQIIYWTVEGKLFITNVESKQPYTVQLAEEVTSATYSPTGRTLAVLRTDQYTVKYSPGIYLLDLDTKKEILLTNNVASGIGIRGYTPLWSEDGEYLIFLQKTPQDTRIQFGILNIAQQRQYTLTSVDSLPIPVSPPILQDEQLVYQSDYLNESSKTWVVNIDFDQGKTTNVQSKEISLKDISMLSTTLYNVKYQRPTGGSITSFFSHSNTIPSNDGPYNYYCTNQGRSGHRGTDFSNPLNTAIRSGASGVVEFFNNTCTPTNSCPNQPGDTCGSGFGNYVRVRHTNNTRTYYAHMSQTNVATSQNVYKSTTIGYVGSTGSSTGCHLHFEIRYPDTNSSNAVDPYYGPCNWITQSLWEGAQPQNYDQEQNQ